MQGGDQLCELSCEPSAFVTELKAQIQVDTGKDAATLRLYLPSAEEPLGERDTLQSHGMPAELYAVTLEKIDIAQFVGVARSELADKQVQEACCTEECQAGGIIDLRDCYCVKSVSSLLNLTQMQELDITHCTDVDPSTVVQVLAAARSVANGS